MIWRRSSTCESGTCIEVADDGSAVYLRNSQSGLIIHATRAEWEAFRAGVIAGDFDDAATD